MADYTSINFGKPNWNKDINDTFDKIFAGGVVNDSGWVDCATLVNGARAYTVAGAVPTDEDNKKAIERRVLDFGKFKLVMIIGAITVDGIKTLTTTALVNLPTGLPVTKGQAFGLVSTGSFASFVRWNLTANGSTIEYVGGDIDSTLPDSNFNMWLPINMWYISD